jgi:hypothetical protein
VVGWRWLSNGIGNYDSEDGNSYTATESVFAIEVKRGMMNKVDLVLPESLILSEDQLSSNSVASQNIGGMNTIIISSQFIMAAYIGFERPIVGLPIMREGFITETGFLQPNPYPKEEFF